MKIYKDNEFIKVAKYRQCANEFLTKMEAESDVKLEQVVVDDSVATFQYGGQFCTGKKASIDLENNSRHDNYAITDDKLARFEKILMNIKADHERYLVDCHYKDAPNK